MHLRDFFSSKTGRKRRVPRFKIFFKEYCPCMPTCKYRYQNSCFTKLINLLDYKLNRLPHQNEKIKVKELIYSAKHIKEMKRVIGDDLTLKIYISPGGEPHTAWDDEAQKDINTETKRPSDWQYNVIRKAFLLLLASCITGSL